MRSASSRFDEVLAGVYGAALAAAADADAASDAVAAVFRDDPAGWRAAPAEELAARAILLAVRCAPHPAYAAIAPDDREAVALARVLRWPVSRIAGELLVDAVEVRARLARALRAVAADRCLMAA